MKTNLTQVERMFFELLQVALGTRDVLSRVPYPMEWEQLFEEAENQAITGLLLTGLERLAVSGERIANCMPPLEVKLQWIGEVQMIEEQNRVMSKACREVVVQFEKDGFKCCVLKGQANLRYYPVEMRLRRSCGDIDIWVKPVSGERLAVSGPVRRTLEYVERKHELTGLCWLHCNYDHSEDVPVEVHFRPSFMNEPCKNRRFLKHFTDIEKCTTRDNSDGIELPVMKVEEDVVYQMNHIYRHLLDEGVGLRQIVDYFFLLKQFNGYRLSVIGNEAVSGERLAVSDEETLRVIEWLGMKRFAGALMYVMKEVCGMNDEELLCEPNEKEGKFLMNEIMTAGNFGQVDPRMGELNTSSLLKRQVSQAWRRIKRNMRFVKSYPGEVIWEPVARMEHFAWKKLRLWRV